MARINVDTAQLFKNYELTVNSIKKNIRQLSSGEDVNRPKDGVTMYEKASYLDFERSSDLAKVEAIQTRISWFQTTLSYMEEIRETLSSMAEVAMQASSGSSSVEDLELMDLDFQGKKRHLSDLIDGQGGMNLPRATFGDVPLLLSFSPDVILNDLVPQSDPTMQAINLYTGYERAGFDTLPLIGDGDEDDQGYGLQTPKFSGTADAGSTTSITLPNTASEIEDVYVGMEIEITGGTGSGQTARIASYDYLTRVATFETALSTAVDNTSTFTIDSGYENRALIEFGGRTEVNFASSVWGADNYRLDQLSEDGNTFKSLTAEEATYRSANSIPNSDLVPRTPEEKLLRRQMNIFDPRFGNLKSPENAKRMVEQIEKAVDQIAVLMSREDSKAESLQFQYEHFTRMGEHQELGIQNFTGVEFQERTTDLSKLNLRNNVIFELAGRINRSYALLTTLVTNRGKRGG